MSRLLLDTHVWLWYIRGSADLPSALREAIDERLGLLWLSPISVWEAGVLARKGRIRVRGDVGDWLRDVQAALPLREAPITVEVARRVHDLDLPHSDPADGFIAATALVYGLTLVTVDQHLRNASWLATLSS